MLSKGEARGAERRVRIKMLLVVITPLAHLIFVPALFPIVLLFEAALLPRRLGLRVGELLLAVFVVGVGHGCCGCGRGGWCG